MLPTNPLLALILHGAYRECEGVTSALDDSYMVTSLTWRIVTDDSEPHNLRPATISSTLDNIW
jgi:hypothetical protein